MNNFGRGNWFLMFFVLVVGMVVLVSAEPIWNSSSNDNLYYFLEGTEGSHNFTVNLSDISDLSFFSILNISWGQGALGPSHSDFYWLPWGDNGFSDSASGVLNVNTTRDNETGSFDINVHAQGDETGMSLKFNFIINATNDAPNFTSTGIANSYTFSAGETTSFNLTGADEEDHFPFVYDVVFNETNCTHGTETGYSDNSDCNLSVFGLSVNSLSDTVANISFSPNANHVGTYWANVSIMDAAVDYDCPHDWCDATYNTSNMTTYYSQMVLFTVSPPLAVDISNCTGVILNESEPFNCTIVVTTPGETDSLTLSSNASFKVGATTGQTNRSWFYAGGDVTASSFNYNVSISVTPGKADVGNYTINFTAVDTTSGLSNFTLIDVYVNYTEFAVTLDSIAGLNDSNALYANTTFEVNATDTDLLILDGTIKKEVLTFASNTSWVGVVENPGAGAGKDYTTTTVSVDYDWILNNGGVDNYAVKINVTDDVGNSANRSFVIEINNGSAPDWNATLSDLVVVNLIEGTLFTYNVSMNVSDEDPSDTISFFFNNFSAEFCSLNDTTFNRTTGIINFTPQDCDVGYHNVMITASDSFLNSTKQFNFTVQNIADAPTIIDLTLGVSTIAEGSPETGSEGTEATFILLVEDDDFLIPSGQRTNFYNESLSVGVISTNSTNSTGSEKSLFNLTFIGMNGADDSWAEFNGSFTPDGTQVGNYTVFINITDASGNEITRTFYLNISETLSAPNLTLIDNQSLTIYEYFNITVNATDDEDDRNGIDLNYSIYPLGVSYPTLTMDNVTGRIDFDFDSNESYAGIWGYNVTVNDSNNQVDYQVFYLTVYGNQTLLSPSEGIIFNVTENAAGYLNFTTNHSVGDNITYEYWIDSMTCSYQNNSNCTYGDLSLRETSNFMGNGTQNNWSFLSNFTDETYDNLKNLTVRVYPTTSDLNSTQILSVATNFTFKLNISHANAPVTIPHSFPNPYPAGDYGNDPIDISLGSYFSDVDYSDSYYLQNVTFTVSSNASNSIIRAESNVVDSRLPWNGTVDSWSLQLYGEEVGSEEVTIVANDSFGTVSSAPFTVTFEDPTVVVVTTPTPSTGGSSTKLKYYSLKLVFPQDVIISDENYIDIPFSIQNNGQIDLKGINLNSFVRFNDEFSEDLSISLEDNYIASLKFGQSENFSMRIFANTQKSGRYKATIFANVTSPKFSDWGDFFIDLRRTNESEAEQILIFTEKFIAENPECLELTELINEAEEAFARGEYSNSLRLATEVTEACEDAISANEQIKYPITGFVRDNFYYISFSTLVIFLAGFIFYVYKRVRFNKYKVDNYV